MDNWKQSLDRYITREPNADFNNWSEKVVDAFSHEFWIKNEQWIDEYDGRFSKMLNYLYDKEYTAKRAAYLIEKIRTYNLKIR